MTSSSNEQPSTGNFTALSESECKELLAQQTAGRVGFTAPDGPLILPRTSPVGPLAELVRRTSVAFEIDGFDEETKSGWSVLIRGFAEAVPHNYLLTSAWESGPVPWAEGIRNVFIEIKPHKISGRAVQGTHGD